jgi:hypothetical protein
MSQDIAWPQNFFRQIHPLHESGSIILERSVDGRGKRSRVTASEAEKVARMSCEVPGVYFSVSSFSGMPLLTNFVNTNCLYAIVVLPDEAKGSDWARHAFLREIYNKIEHKGFVLPTSVTYDGNRFVLYWVLEREIAKHEFYKVFLYQQALYILLKDIGLSRDSLEVSSLVPLIGTVNPETGQIVSLMVHQGEKLKITVAESKLLNVFLASEMERFRRNAYAVLELLRLFHDRLFFGASLSHFCTEKQLVEELKALAVSLENKKWKDISGQYEELISDIAYSEVKGEFRHNGVHLSSNNSDWFDLVHGKLNISNDEIQRLKLSVLSGEQSGFDFNSEGFELMSVGESDFIPMERLMFRKIA